MRILLQFPEGLKQTALAQAAKLEAKGHEIFLSASACFGACDLPLEETRVLKIQKILHFGHAEFMKVKISGVKIEYIPCFAEIPLAAQKATIEKAAQLLVASGAKKLALVFPIQQLKNSPLVKSELEAKGFFVAIGKGGAHVKHMGQVLGCDPSAAYNGAAAQSDTIIYYGGGRFHPTGIPSTKPVLCIDPHLGSAYWITDELVKQEKRRKGALLAASEAKTFGILVSTKCGQCNLAAAKQAKKLIEKKGRRAEILVANEFSPISLANFLSFNAYINTACPRISDDGEAYGKPIVNALDIKRLIELLI